MATEQARTDLADSVTDQNPIGPSLTFSLLYGYAFAMQESPTDTMAAQPEGIRETIDSIVIALILAFVFRAFIVEAFIIPTGSMASTLNGAHGTMVCQNCGWEFAYGLTDPSIIAARGGVPRFNEESTALCPNCRYPNRTLEINDRRADQETGDRILVLKWPFDVGGPLLGPQRWNVVVFKDPSDGTTNYIKRLAGLPNEVLEILDGDVYTVPVSKVSAQTLETLDRLRHIKYLRRTGSSPFECDRLEEQLAPAQEAVLTELDNKLRIARKSLSAQKDLWRIVHDLDYPPKERHEHQPYWLADRTANAWDVDSRTLRFNGPDAPEQAVRLIASIDSFCGYNTVSHQREIPGVLARLAPVSDMRVRLVLDYHKGEGAVRVRLIKRDRMFAGELRADGSLRLLGASTDDPENWKVLESTQIPRLESGQQIELSMSNLDYRVRLAVDGDTLLATDDEEYSPEPARLRRRPPSKAVSPAIYADHLYVELRHVVVESDIYYLELSPPNAALTGFTSWGTRNHPILLREGEHFMLGDNSAQSKDSRLWDKVGPHLLAEGEAYQLGTVPRDQLIGRAFSVYWPSGLRSTLVPFLRDRGWIPNFGRMRWIR